MWYCMMFESVVSQPRGGTIVSLLSCMLPILVLLAITMPMLLTRAIEPRIIYTSIGPNVTNNPRGEVLLVVSVLYLSKPKGPCS